MGMQWSTKFEFECAAGCDKCPHTGQWELDFKSDIASWYVDGKRKRPDCVGFHELRAMVRAAMAANPDWFGVG